MGQTVKDILDVIHMNEHNIEVAKRNVQEFYAILARKVSPHQVGDIVTIEGYAYRGKRGKVTRVYCIRAESFGDGKDKYKLVICADVVNKAGTAGSRKSQWGIILDEDGNLTNRIEGWA
jgi:hypothetical protein